MHAANTWGGHLGGEWQPLGFTDMGDVRGDERNMTIGEPETSAVGVPGVAVSMRYALGEMGVARLVRTLLRVN